MSLLLFVFLLLVHCSLLTVVVCLFAAYGSGGGHGCVASVALNHKITKIQGTPWPKKS